MATDIGVTSILFMIILPLVTYGYFLSKAYREAFVSAQNCGQHKKYALLLSLNISLIIGASIYHQSINKQSGIDTFLLLLLGYSYLFLPLFFSGMDYIIRKYDKNYQPWWRYNPWLLGAATSLILVYQIKVAFDVISVIAIFNFYLLYVLMQRSRYFCFKKTSFNNNLFIQFIIFPWFIFGVIGGVLFYLNNQYELIYGPPRCTDETKCREGELLDDGDSNSIIVNKENCLGAKGLWNDEQRICNYRPDKN